MVYRSWDLPQLGGSATTTSPPCPLWGSVRLTYTICAFLSNVLQIGMRNMLGMVILHMVKMRPEDAQLLQQQHLKNLTIIAECGHSVLPQSEFGGGKGDLPWTRSQEVTFPGTFFYGFVIALPLAGHLSDRFGGKILFIISLTLQGLAYMLLPHMAYHSYAAAVVVLVIAGIFAGCGSPSLYQLFVVWSHPTERTALLSFAYGGHIVGSICIFPLANYLSHFSWTLPFYVLGCVSLVYGISAFWLIYNNLEEHPRLSAAEREYLRPKEFAGTPQNFKIPWKSVLTSMPVIAFVLTHMLNSYGFLLLSLNVPRFLREAMHINMNEIGYLSSAPFLGSFLSKLICVLSCSYVERRIALKLTMFRRILYTSCCTVTIILIGIIIFASCEEMLLVLLMYVLLGATTDLGFSAGYWPTLLYFAPSFAGLLSGFANSLANISGFGAPQLVAKVVVSGNKSEWNIVLYTLIVNYALAMIVFGMFSSTKLQSWDPRSRQQTLSSTRDKSVS